MDRVTGKELPELFEAIAAKFEENADMLCEMDSKMGDGDLGLTMRKGFGGLPEIIRTMDEENFSKKLRKAGMEMTDLVPSTMGMLMGTGISFGGKSLGEKSELDGEGLTLFLEGFCAGIVKRGKCAEGDRTVLDCFAPAAKKARAFLAEKPAASLEQICKVAMEGAKEGVEAIKEYGSKIRKSCSSCKYSAGCG